MKANQMLYQTRGNSFDIAYVTEINLNIITKYLKKILFFIQQQQKTLHKTLFLWCN